jgi:hypothetical protein
MHAGVIVCTCFWGRRVMCSCCDCKLNCGVLSAVRTVEQECCPHAAAGVLSVQEPCTGLTAEVVA